MGADESAGLEVAGASAASEAPLSALEGRARSTTIAQRLADFAPSSDLAKEIHDATIRQLAEEERRRTGIEAKASGLIQSVGISLTLLTTFGASLLSNESLRRSAGDLVFLWKSALMLGVAAGLAVTWYALQALKIGTSKGMSAEDIFDRKTLLTATTLAAAAPGTKADVAHYFRFLAVNNDQLFTHNSRRSEEKADWVKKAQKAHAFMLAALAALALFIVIADPPAEKSRQLLLWRLPASPSLASTTTASQARNLNEAQR